MEESQATYWADIAQQILISKTMDSIPGLDPRVFPNRAIATHLQMYRDIYRVDANGNMVPDGPVQVIALKGPLMEDDYCGSAGMSTMQQALRAANADESIESIVLYNDSPGGTVSGTHNLAREVKRSKKPVVSFVNKMMCSANYWIGSSAQEVIADDENNGYNTMIGSIGTVATIMDRTAEMENRGIKLRRVYASKSTRKGKYNEDVMAGTEEGIQRLVNELDRINDFFLSSVIENRGQKLKLDKENVLEGDVYDVKDSIRFGLVDRMGSFQYAVKRSLMLAKSIK